MAWGIARATGLLAGLRGLPIKPPPAAERRFILDGELVRNRQGGVTPVRWRLLSAAFAARDLDRTYPVFCWGLPSPAVGEIEGVIDRDPRDRKRMVILKSGGGPPLTQYHLLRTLALLTEVAHCSLTTLRAPLVKIGAIR